MHVSMDVRYPSALLHPTRVVPAPQRGFAVTATAGRVQIEAWFAGKLSVEMRFTLGPAPDTEGE